VGSTPRQLKNPLLESPCDMTRSASTPRLRLTLLYFLALIAVVAFVDPGWTNHGSPSWVIAVLDALALVLVALACLGRIWCSVFVAGRKDATLVTEGPYALCRHPLYVLSFIGGVGLGLATHTMTLTLLTAAVLALLLGSAARGEERLLASLHGETFHCYARDTPRWWPRWSAWTIPASLDVRADVLWKAFVDAGAFFLLYALLVLAADLREGGLLPTLLRLP
jgi:protein-S-isoprenylcysteine O-methyltransferase Ste14